MMKRMKMAFVFLLSMILSACAPNGGSTVTSPSPLSPPPVPPQVSATLVAPTAPEDAKAVRWLIPYSLFTMPKHVSPDTARREAKAIQEAINERLIHAGLQLEIDLFAPENFDTSSDEYYQELYHRIQESGPYDLVSFSRYTSLLEDWFDELMFRDIAPELERFTFLADAITSWQLEQMWRKGRIYYISSVSSSDFNELTYLLVNQTTLRALNLDAPTTIDEYLAAAEVARANGLPYATAIRTLDAFRRDYDDFPFQVYDHLFVFHENGSIEPYASSQVLVNDHHLSKSLHAIGDNAVFESISYQSYGDQWPFFGSAPYFVDNFSLNVFVAAHPEMLALIKLNPSAPELMHLNPYRYGITAIPAASQDDRGLRFLDWLYSDIDHYNLLVYGVLGRHYEIDANGIMDASQLPNAYNFRNEVKQPGFSNSYPGQFELIDELYGMHSYAAMPWYGFIFDDRPVKEDYDAVMSIVTGEGGITDIARGKIALSSQKQLTDDLKAAGFDAVLEECVRQYSDFLQKKGWVYPE